jgi:hypothetical protein
MGVVGHLFLLCDWSVSDQWLLVCSGSDQWLFVCAMSDQWLLVYAMSDQWLIACAMTNQWPLAYAMSDKLLLVRGRSDMWFYVYTIWMNWVIEADGQFHYMQLMFVCYYHSQEHTLLKCCWFFCPFKERNETVINPHIHQLLCRGRQRKSVYPKWFTLWMVYHGRARPGFVCRSRQKGFNWTSALRCTLIWGSKFQATPILDLGI